MKIITPLAKRLNLQGPVIAAPMAGGPTTPELVAAVSHAGGLGSLAAAYLSPEEIDQAVAKIRGLTTRPFLINLFAPMPDVNITKPDIEKAIAATQKFRDELGLSAPVLRPPYHPDFDRQFEQVLRAKPIAFSFIFGLLDRKYLEECRKNKIFTLGTATTVQEALALEASGVDAIIAQGTEAGAHHGIFSPDAHDPEIPMLELTQLCSAKLRIPVIAAGGMMNGSAIAEALQAGAAAAVLGTAFLLCPEAGTSQPYRQAIIQSTANPRTRLTRAFSGRLARGMENRFLNEMEQAASAILPFPVQNALTRDIRNQATQLGKAEYLSLWAGMGFGQIREMRAEKLVRTLFEEME